MKSFFQYFKEVVKDEEEIKKQLELKGISREKLEKWARIQKQFWQHNKPKEEIKQS